MKNPLKFLILLTVFVSLATPFIPPLQSLLPLSWKGIEHLYLWQLITYLFITPGPLSFGFLLQLAFNALILWTFGTALIERSRTRLFLGLYFGAGLFSALCSLPPLAFSNTALIGNIGPVYAVMIAWMMINPGAQILLFFTLPFKAHWLILGLVGASLFLDLAYANWVEVIALSSSVLYGYLFALIAWREQGPIPFLRIFERKILRLLERPKKGAYRHSKIYDIHSGKPILKDDQFMDAMLARISLYGEGTLTPEEKKRMQEISARKAPPKK